MKTSDGFLTRARTLLLSFAAVACSSPESSSNPAPAASTVHLIDPSLALPTSLPPPSREDERRGERAALIESPDLATFLDRASGLFGDEYLDERYAAMPVMQHEGAKLLEEWAHDRLTFLDVADGHEIGASGYPGEPGAIACLDGNRFVMPSGSGVPRVGAYHRNRDQSNVGMPTVSYTIHAFGEVPVATGPFQARFCGVYTGTVFDENASTWKLVGMFDTEANRRHVR